MKPHVKNYLKAMDLIPEDVIICEMCPCAAVDIHHIIYKSQGGSDEFENLIALCRKHHDQAHDRIIEKEELFELKMPQMP